MGEVRREMAENQQDLLKVLSAWQNIEATGKVEDVQMRVEQVLQDLYNVKQTRLRRLIEKQAESEKMMEAEQENKKNL